MPGPRVVLAMFGVTCLVGISCILVYEFRHPVQHVQCELNLPHDADMSSIASTSDDRIAVGYYTGGIDMVTSECESELITQLKEQGVTISALGFLSDGSCAVVDSSNSLMVFKPRIDKWTKSDVSFEGLSQPKGKLLVSLCVHGVGRNERIYVSYREDRKILVFSPSGGKAKTIYCNYEPWQITSFIKDIIVTGESTVRIIDHINGKEKHKRDMPTDEKKSGVYPFAGVTKRDTVLIAWVDHNNHGDKYRRVRIDEYTQELKHDQNLIYDHKIPKHDKRWWYFVTEFKSGEIAFCMTDKLYIFKPVNTLYTKLAYIGIFILSFILMLYYCLCPQNGTVGKKNI